MENYVEFDPGVKMNLEPGAYAAKIISVNRPTGTETFKAADFAVVWRVTEGDFRGMEVKQSFRYKGGDAEQNEKGKRKLNVFIGELFGTDKGKVPDIQFLEKEAVISVKEYDMDGRSGVYVAKVVAGDDDKITKLGVKTPNQATNDFDDEVVF